MKILLCANNFTGSNIMLSRFVQHLSGHEIKIAAYYKNNKYLKTIDWCLDPFTVFFKKNYFLEKFGIYGPVIDFNLGDLIIDDLLDWKPDLIINDCEFITATIAKVLDIPIWYCSPLLQITGLFHDRLVINTINDFEFKRAFEKFPKGEEYFIYSPLCDISIKPLLKQNYTWIRPYYELPNEFTTEDISLQDIQRIASSLVTTGETSFVADCLYNNKDFLISPNHNDIEQNLNARLFNWYGIAGNIGRSFNMNFIKTRVEKFNKSYSLNIQNWNYLHEKLYSF